MRWAKHAVRIGRRGINTGFWWESRNRQLGKPRRTCKDNIKMYVRKTGWCDTDWIDLAEDRDQWRALVNMVTNLRAL
jgi:hypothetical protein